MVLARRDGGVGEGRGDVGHALHGRAQLAATLVEADASEDIAKREDVARGEAVKPLVEGAGVKAVVLADVADLEISAHGEVEDEVDAWSREQREESDAKVVSEAAWWASHEGPALLFPLLELGVADGAGV